jgi:hypothetical protein
VTERLAKDFLPKLISQQQNLQPQHNSKLKSKQMYEGQLQQFVLEKRN